MNFLRKQHERLVPPGREVAILRWLPRIAVLGSLIIAALPVLVRAMPAEPGIDAAKHVRTVDIFAIASEITFLTALFTIAIGCIVVHIMKGPAYLADSIPVEHADRPSVAPRDSDSK